MENVATGRSIAWHHAWVLLAVIMVTGCANPPPAPSAPSAPTTAIAPAQAASKTAIAPTPPAPKTAIAPAAPTPKTATAPATSAPKPANAAVAPPQKSASAQAAAAKAAPATLDLDSLEARLRNTSAIGVMTKLTLKNQVDDLLDQFRAFYAGKLSITIAALRKSYDLLVLKVLALLQDADPALANAIATSREAIWGILSDPKKFAAA